MSEITDLYDTLVRSELKRTNNANTIVALLDRSLQRLAEDWQWSPQSKTYFQRYVCPVCESIKDYRVNADAMCKHKAEGVLPSTYRQRKEERARRKAQEVPTT